jgi:ribosome-associated protein
MIKTEKLAVAVHSLDAHLAKDLVAIDVQGISPITDYFLFATGGSITQTKALCDYVEKDMAAKGYTPKRIEGYATSRWILMDYGDVVLHIFLKEVREFYDLERLWQDGTIVDITEYMETEGDTHAL